MKADVWILGATGRTGADVARRLDAAGTPLVLVGRSAERLAALNGSLGGRHRVLVAELDAALSHLAADAPGVVVNTVGPFAATARRVATACPAGTHYVDIANEFGPVSEILALSDSAVANGQTLVTGAGFGVLGTESVTLRVCAGEPAPARVRVDAIPSLALDGGTVGRALAGSIVEVMQFGGREVRGGQLVRAATAGHPRTIVTPDGDRMFTGSGANGELLAAWHASAADTVIAASTAVPANALARHLAIPLLSVLVRIPGVAGFLQRRIAGVKLAAGPMARQSSWGHVHVEWEDGTARDGWLRVGDGGVVTADVMAEVTRRLLAGDGRPGAFTPGALFGTELAEAVGGVFSIGARA